MNSRTEIVDGPNGTKTINTYIGTVTLTEPWTYKTSEQTACNYTLIEVPAGTYEVRLSTNLGMTWGLVDYEGIVTDEHFVNRFFHASSLAEPRNIGKTRKFATQSNPYSLAERFGTDARFELAADWALEIEQREYSDGRPYAAFAFRSPEGKRIA